MLDMLYLIVTGLMSCMRSIKNLKKLLLLIPPPQNCHTIGTKWVFKNKHGEDGLVALHFCQKEGIDYDETFALVAHLEAIRIFLDFFPSKCFKLFQMDAKSFSLNGYIKEKLYMRQHPSFESFKFPNHVFKLQKALYGLKQAPSS
jgi:hypothetical protein